MIQIEKKNVLSNQEKLNASHGPQSLKVDIVAKYKMYRHYQ